MQFENLGHESWLFYTKTTKILIDPLLSSTFGCSSDYQLVKTSHATLKEDILKSVNAVILTTDHFQHYDIASLEKIENKFILYVSESFSIEKVIELRDRGFEPIICKHGQLISCQDVEFVFVPADDSTYFWDSRVCSLMIASDVKDNLKKQWLFLQSDTSINKEVETYVPSSWDVKPSFVIIVCHYKQYEEYGYSPWDNFMSHPLTLDTGPISIDFLSALFPVEIYPLNIASCYILSGGEYECIDRRRPNATFDNSNIADFINKILVNSQAYVAVPGVAYSTSEPTSIRNAIYSEKEIHDRNEVSIQEPFFVFSKSNKFDQDDQLLIERGLKHLEKSFLFSKFGNQLLFMNEYLDSQLSSERFFIKLLNGENCEIYVFCFAKSTFLKKDLNDDELFKYPAGIVIDKLSFLDIVKQKTSATEALTNNIIQWYVGSIDESPLALIYTAFSKLVYPNHLILNFKNNSANRELEEKVA